jgi:hypothetical protein
MTPSGLSSGSKGCSSTTAAGGQRAGAFETLWLVGLAGNHAPTPSRRGVSNSRSPRRSRARLLPRLAFLGAAPSFASLAWTGAEPPW